MNTENTTIDIATFLKDYGGHILAFIALIQVWLIAFWKNFIVNPTANIYPTASIEVGFSNFGPTIALLGTLRAEKGDIFINKMQVRVVRLRDKAEHIFSWRAFRPNEIATNLSTNIQLHIASGFLITPKAPKQYHVFFASDSFSSEYQEHIQPLRESWIAFAERTAAQPDENITNQIAKSKETTSEVFSKFISSGKATSFYNKISNDFFWHTGKYKIIFTVENDGRHPIANEWEITITEKDERDLRLNTITIVQELCGLPVNYNFSYKEYPKTSS